MGHMNWIHTMIVNGSYSLFKEMTSQAINIGAESFDWGDSVLHTQYAKYVCEYVDEHAMPNYENHIIETSIDNQGGIL